MQKLGTTQGGGFPYPNPTISIFYPAHAQFETYDAIAVFSENNKLECVYGYQLKEGRANSSRLADKSFNRSFVIKGMPSNVSIKNGADGWSIPSKEAIVFFWGVWKTLDTTGLG